MADYDMNHRLIALIGLIAFLAVYRLFPHPPNLTPVAAMALFGGAQLPDKKLAFVVPLSALLMSDLVLGLYATMPFVYAAFALTVLIGFWLGHYRHALPVVGAALLSSVLFFVLTNFGVWLGHNMYPPTLDGLLAAYTAALPFFRNTLFGNVGFTLLLFGGLWLAERSWPALSPQRRDCSNG